MFLFIHIRDYSVWRKYTVSSRFFVIETTDEWRMIGESNNEQLMERIE